MGWVFFVELELSCPAASWTEITHLRAADTVLEAGWSGLAAKLERELAKDFTRGASFETVLRERYVDPERIFEVVERDGRTHVHVLALLDESNLDQAFVLGATMYAARARGGAGHLRFVNDGAYFGDKGSTLTLDEGAITRTTIVDHWEASAPMREALEQHVR